MDLAAVERGHEAAVLRVRHREEAPVGDDCAEVLLILAGWRAEAMLHDPRLDGSAARVEDARAVRQHEDAEIDGARQAIGARV